LASVGLALALCSLTTAARADEDDSEVLEMSSESSHDVPELDSRAAGLALTVLGGALFALNGRKRRALTTI
jgi:hypothetical protein